MGHPVYRQSLSQTRRQQTPPAPPAPPRPNVSEPRLLPLLLPIFIVGGLAILHVLSLARLSELEAEANRLERLTLQQKSHFRELKTVQDKLTDRAPLIEYGLKHGMVPPGPVKPIQVGVLPPGKVHWVLPNEGPDGTQPQVTQIAPLPGSQPATP